MKVLVFLSFVLSTAFMLGMDWVLWTEDPLYGVGGLIGTVGFFIAYALSGDVIIAPRDFWRLSSWQVFKKKMGWAMGAYLIISLVAGAVIASYFA